MIKGSNDRILIDGFLDVLVILDDFVMLLYPTYNLEIKGIGLKVAAFTKSELILFGQIMNVEFVYHV